MTAIALAAALAATPALAQDTNGVEPAVPAENTTTATTPDANMMTTNEVVLAPGEATTAMPVEPITAEPVTPPAPERDSGRFPWGLLGLLGLVGLLGRARSRTD